MAIEQPKFEVLKKDEDIELRQYSGYLVTTVATAAENFASAVIKHFHR